MPSRYIIQVAPLIPLPILRTQVFSYWHNEGLPAGTLVSAHFYFREIKGIVLGSQKSSRNQEPMKLKNIISVIEEKYLSESQISLALKISDYYFSPLGSVMKLMVPKAVKYKMKEKIIPPKRGKISKISESSRKILESKNQKILLVGNSWQREKINADLVREYIKKDKQCLILVPEIFLSQSIFEKIQHEFSEEAALIHSRITKSQYYAHWEKIRKGETKIVVASKQGIFLPFSDLGLVIVQEEQDMSFKQGKAMPRYNGVRGAEFLAEIAGAKLILESSTPSAESFERSKENELEFFNPARENRRSPKIEIVLLEKEKENADFPISKTLYSRLAEVMNNGKQAVIFVNRRGFSTRTICENCKKILKCPKCDLALIYSEEEGFYRCLHCAYKTDLFIACPSCGGFQFSHRGIGTQTVEKKIKKLFPSACIARLDADILSGSAKTLEILRKFSTGEIDLLVGTQSVIKAIYSGNIGLVGAVSARDFVEGLEFRSRELALSRLFQMANLTDEKGTVVIQSFFGANPLFESFLNFDLKKYYDRELATRKKFHYPPFRKFVKLIFRDKSEKIVESETRKIFDLLKATGNNKIEIKGLYKTFSRRRIGLYHGNMLLKIDPAAAIRDLPIRSVLGALRKGWSVDIDPMTLF